jgi:GH24 family phage-related lysozyme (muramidase)
MTITADTKFDPRISRKLAELVDASEDDALEAYPDSLGNWTIGRGHLMPPAAPGRSWKGFTIIQSTSDRYFNDDLISAMTMAEKLAEWPKCDTPARQDALVELCFNLGGRWGHFVITRDCLSKQDWDGVAENLLDSLWAHQVGKGFYPDGKPKRATRIAYQFQKGNYYGV